MIDQDVTDQNVADQSVADQNVARQSLVAQHAAAQDARNLEADPRQAAEGAAGPATASSAAPAAPAAAEGTAAADEASPSTTTQASNGGVGPERRPDSADARPSDRPPAEDDDASSTVVSAAKGGRRTRSRVTRQQLEEEGDIAADYLEELLDIVDLDGDIDIDVENDRAAISIIGDGVAQRSLKRLVGDGDVLEAVQELTRLAVQTKTGERSRLMLDIARFRAQRKEELEHVARDAISRHRESAAPVHLDPMTPFERKVVHDVVATAGLRSESEGDGENRHVVITSGA